MCGHKPKAPRPPTAPAVAPMQNVTTTVDTESDNKNKKIKGKRRLIIDSNGTGVNI